MSYEEELYTEIFESASDTIQDNVSVGSVGSVIKTELKQETTHCDEIETFIAQTGTIHEYTDLFEDDEDDEVHESFNEYSETFEKDESAISSAYSIKTVKSRPLTGRSKPFSMQLTIHKEENEDEDANTSYSDTFESLSEIQPKQLQQPSLQRMYTETFCSLSSSSIDSDLLEARDLDLKELAKKVKYKIRQKLEAPKRKPQQCSVGLLDSFKNRIEKNLNKDPSITVKPHRSSQFCAAVVKDKLIDRLQTDHFIDDLKNEYDKKVANFGSGLVDECFPELKGKQLKTISEFRREEYYKQKCNYLKFKQESESPSKYDQYAIDGLCMIGDLAKHLPKPTTSPDVIWAMLMEPLRNANKIICPNGDKAGLD